MRGEVNFSDPIPAVKCNQSEFPLYSQFDLTLAGDIALHNRSQLLNDLGRQPLGISQSSDLELTLAAYDKWGVKCPEFLQGEFSFAIWDDKQHHLFCCRDQMGARSFFYFIGKRSILFASDLLRILDSPQVPRKLNAGKLAALAFPGGLKHYPDETFHSGIGCLPPGSWMVVNGSGARRQTYWQPEIRDDLVPKREEDVFARLAALLNQAIEVRIHPSRTPAALLSGGLDSSAIVSLAGRHLASRGRSLMAVGAVLSDEMRGRIGDEKDYIDEFRGFAGVRIEYLTLSDQGPFDSIAVPSAFQASFLGGSRLYLHRALEAAAIATGADLLFDGDGGEYGPTNAGVPYYAELALTGRWITLLQEIKAGKRVGGRSPLRELAGQVRNLATRRSFFRPQVLLSSDFVKSAGMNPNTAQKKRWPDQRAQQQAELRSWLSRSALRVDLTGYSRIRRSYPLLDKRVVEFCLAVPSRYKVRNGYNRYLVREALEGVLPPKIQWRTSKTPFSPDYYRRYNKQLPKAREFVAAIRGGDPIRSVVDIEALTRLLNRPPVPDGDVAALGIIPNTIYLMCFLRQFPEFKH